MSLVLPILLCLRLYLGECMQAQRGNLTQPAITAQPESLVLRDKPVTITCQGPPEAEAYKILKKGEQESTVAENSTLYIQQMTAGKTGLYHCSYRIGECWSQPSGPLLLAMTGAYQKPSLSNLTGTVVTSGDEVMLKCFSKLSFDTFILTKDGVHTTQCATRQDNVHQTIFHSGPVTRTQAGTYRCYGAFNKDPYLWSYASVPLELVFKDQSPNLLILIGLPVASLLLLGLIILFIFLYHHKAKNKAAKTGRQPQAEESMSKQASEARDPQDVTYFQVAFRVPTQGTFSTPRPTQISNYATVALS
ncbi:leukocyte immunoglobulin-like receptor subfamily A member 6 isoform X1 [Pteronotus mesoamericanus]|uniref:leukocyte immunoglobulin-like receptor subfamily A member 6 isoform X1 n=1 Tax=Pteronotus mesoamericanus TaxID=1884717 RepID=UPI0023EA9980|nr:leukocyte immunoglobulin-like receptor subfamily A member 6 isoform X1 [Pteronotus parnellii mesoamericanus]